MGYSSPKNTERWGDWAKKEGVDRPPYSDRPAEKADINMTQAWSGTSQPTPHSSMP